MTSSSSAGKHFVENTNFVQSTSKLAGVLPRTEGLAVLNLVHNGLLTQHDGRHTHTHMDKPRNGNKKKI